MSLAYKISAFNRTRKWNLFLRHFPILPNEKVLDVGFSDKEYSATDNFLEKHYPYRANITALGVDEPKEFPARYPEVRAVRYDGKTFPFADNEFDIVWSNAVLEHVGNRVAQINFLREIKRVGKRGFITTPNKLFPIEVHTRTPFLHWLPKSWFDKFLRTTGRSWAAGDYMHLLSEKELRELLHEAGIENFSLHKNRLFGLVVDFVVVF